ncbi:hypothetical protein [Formosa maritima]|uniref:Uncharacterized protein n=1 Tax=Formosa maritima TaxID=2592046 RepID=A0A5D0GHA5_9FLAO|nr:hypothetical protein [Formosa maritima]TYA58263.1 hypothetical protein FVF61_03550 [Formosa maritima]
MKKKGQVELSCQSKLNQKQVANELLDKTVEDCNKHLASKVAVLECMLELDNLLIKNSLCKKKHLYNNP